MTDEQAAEILKEHAAANGHKGAYWCFYSSRQGDANGFYAASVHCHYQANGMEHVIGKAETLESAVQIVIATPPVAIQEPLNMPAFANQMLSGIADVQRIGA